MRQTPILALFVPLALIAIVHGWRGVRETWPAAVVCGLVFALGQYATSSFMSVPLATWSRRCFRPPRGAHPPQDIEALHDLGVAPEKHRRIASLQRCPAPIRGTVGITRRRPREMLRADPQGARSPCMRSDMLVFGGFRGGSKTKF